MTPAASPTISPADGSAPPASPAPAAIRLGYLAVLPFVVGALAIWLVDPLLRPLAAQVLSTYAAVVLSFIGAIHWGVGFTQAAPATRLFVWGVVPSIVAWIAVLVEPRTGLVVHAAMLVACYRVDRAFYPKEGIATWLPLRLRLTVCATLACIAGAVGS